MAWYDSCTLLVEREQLKPERCKLGSMLFFLASIDLICQNDGLPDSEFLMQAPELMDTVGYPPSLTIPLLKVFTPEYDASPFVSEALAEGGQRCADWMNCKNVTSGLGYAGLLQKWAKNPNLTESDAILQLFAEDDVESEEMTECPECDAEIPATSTDCPECGCDLESDEDETTSEPEDAGRATLVDSDELEEWIEQARILYEQGVGPGDIYRFVDRLFEELLGYDAFEQLTGEHSYIVENAMGLDTLVVRGGHRGNKYIAIACSCHDEDLDDIDPSDIADELDKEEALDAPCHWVVVTNLAEWRINYLEYTSGDAAASSFQEICRANIFTDELDEILEVFEILHRTGVSSGFLSAKRDGIGRIVVNSEDGGKIVAINHFNVSSASTPRDCS